MNILSEAIHLITHPPGDLVYFLVTLFALQQAFFPVLTARREKPANSSSGRWVWCLGGMLLGRIVLMLVALLGNVDVLDPVDILPPLERWVTFASATLVVWAALLGTRPTRWATLLLAFSLILSLVFYGYCAMIWPAQAAANRAYNNILQAQIWEASGALLFLIAIIGAVGWRPPEWEWIAGLSLFWLVGHVTQLLWPDVQTHFAGWQRLTSLVTFPLLSVLVHKQLSSSLKEVVRTSFMLNNEALLDLVRGVEFSRELEPSLIIASSRLAHLLKAEMCAIALTTEDNEAQMRVVAMHPPNASQIEAPELEWGAYSTLYEVYTTQQPGIAQPPSSYPWLVALYRRLGFQRAGPIAVLPLSYNNQAVGLLLLGNPQSGRSWERDMLGDYRLVATLIAAAIMRAQGKSTSLLARMRGQDSDHQRLESALDKMQAEVDNLNQRITVLTQEIESREKEIVRLNKELTAQTDHISETELSFWQNEVRELSRDREMLLKDRTLIAEQLSDMKEMLDTTTDTRDRLQAQLTKTQQTLEVAQQNLDAVQKSIAVGLVVVDENGQIVMADALARRMLHLPQGEVTGMPIDGAYPDPQWAKSIDELLSDNPDAKRRAHLTLKEFEGIVDADLVTLAGRDGIPDGIVITLRTPESAAERQEAIVSIANEFRTPMTAITGYADLLLGEQAGLLTEMQQQFLERVRANVEQLGHLLNDIVSTASPDSRPIELSPQLINLIEIIEEAIMGLAARFRERRLAVRLDLPPELSLVRADRDSLYQIILRLLSNAAQCSQEGTEVIIRATQEKTEVEDEAYVCISIVDTGGGIASEDYPRVFRRFYRANQPLIQGMGETGIGMAVAKTLVEANGGRIWVESQEGVGSTFSFVLTADRVEA